MSHIGEDSQLQSTLDVKSWSGIQTNGARWTVRLGDAASVLSTLPERSCNCVVTSPPYFWLRDYKITGQIGLEETVSEYVESLTQVTNQIYRVLSDDGVLFLNLGDTYYSGKGESQGTDPKSKKRRFGLRAVDKSGGIGIGLKPKSLIGIPWRVSLRMLEEGWVLRSSIIWHRKHALQEAVKDRPRRSYEHIFMFVKKRKYYFNRNPLISAEQEDMWTIVPRAKAASGVDTAPFPDEVVERCLDIGCPPNGSVIDPFAGSGTTLRVALTTGRSALGIDLNPEFCRHMVKQLEGLQTTILSNHAHQPRTP